MMLAQITEDRLRALRESFNEQAGQSDHTIAFVVLGIVLILAAVGGIVLLRRHRRAEQVRTHVDILSDALQVLALTESDAALIRGIASAARLREPTAMLLSPMNLAVAMEGALSAGSDPRIRAQAEEVSERLFGVPLPALAES